MTGVRAVGPEAAPEVGRILGAGFEDDPVLSWAMSAPGRLAKLQALFTFVAAESTGPHGTTFLIDGAAAAAWLPPGPHAEDEEERGVRHLTALQGAGATEADLRRLGVMGEAMGAVHPTEPHWYLLAVATLPDRRAHGLGRELLAHTLELVDAQRMPAYLESSNPRNISLYERHGFVVTGEIALAGGPPMTPMWRDPR